MFRVTGIHIVKALCYTILLMAATVPYSLVILTLLVINITTDKLRVLFRGKTIFDLLVMVRFSLLLNDHQYGPLCEIAASISRLHCFTLLWRQTSQVDHKQQVYSYNTFHIWKVFVNRLFKIGSHISINAVFPSKIHLLTLNHLKLYPKMGHSDYRKCVIIKPSFNLVQ